MPNNVIVELDTLQNSATHFRDLVNEPRCHYTLFQQTRKFNLVCSAMDIIDDTIFALRSYAQHNHDDQGLAYLEIFGVLQTLSIQQDAIRELYRIIAGCPIDLEDQYPDIKAIRDTRIRVAGHPVGGLASSHFLVRYTVSKWGFELWKFDQSGSHDAEHVDLLALIKKNTLALDGALRSLNGMIEAEQRSHKEKFLGKSLEEPFNLLTYFSEKMFQGVSKRNPIGLVGLESIREIIKNFRVGLEERGQHFQEADFVLHDIPKLAYALDKLERYMRGDETQTEDDAYIVATFIRHEMKHLRQIAKEIDSDYQVQPPGK